MLQKIWEIKILTAHVKAVRTSCGAPDRHIFVISIEIF